jgi:cobalt-zinc-cadmium efflux system membrane fusion protein
MIPTNALSERSIAHTLTALCLLAVACQGSSRAAEPGAVVAPPGEVWLTPRQIADAKIEVNIAEDRAVDDTLVTSGRVAFDDQRVGRVFSPVNGRVVRVLAELGQHVKRGQALAVIESPDIGNAVSDEHKARADLVAAEHDHARQRALLDQHATSETSLEQSEDNWRKAKAELERARQKTYLLRAGGVDAVTQTYTLAAPIEGDVLMRNVSPGVEVQGQYSGGSAVELFTVGDLGRVWVMADLYEIDLDRVRVGSPVSITVISRPGTAIHGEVDWVSGVLDPLTRTAKVRCTLDNAAGLLKPEMYATALIAVQQRNTLAIPRTALLRLGEYRAVFVESGESPGYVHFVRVPVEVEEGEASPWLEVKEGLEHGQLVVTSGAILLSQRL